MSLTKVSYSMISGAPVNVLDYGADPTGTSDSTSAIQAALAVSNNIWFPAGTYKVSSTIRSSVVCTIDGSPDAVIVAASGFTGIDITKIGVAFNLKAIFAVFSGTDIGQQTNPRLGESGKKVIIGPMQLNCANNCDYGVLVNSCPGVQVFTNVKSANVTGIWAGPNCWGSQFQHNRITDCVTSGIYLGQACNGAAIYSPEIWGNSITTSTGVYLEGTVAGTVGAIGQVFISGGYIEKCVTGVYLLNTGSTTIESVDIEGITGNAVYANLTAGDTYGLININGCNLASSDNAIYNSNAYVCVNGTAISDGTSLEPYYSAGANSLFNIQGSRQFNSSGLPTTWPLMTTTQTALAEYQTKYEARVFNKRVTDGSASFSRTWALFNNSSDSQPNETSSALEFRNSRSGDANNSYFSSAVIRANKTTSDPTPRVSSSAAVLVGFLGSSVQSFYPEQDGLMQLGAASNRWTTVYATTGTINTSDANQKQNVSVLDAAEKATALAIKGLMKKFKFKSAVAEKGAGARYHFGVIAQEVQAAFAANGLDATKYGVFCSDTWHTLDDKVVPDGTSGAVEVTQLGVRYEELLCFVIGAM